MLQDRKDHKAAMLGKVRSDDPKYIMGVHLTSAPLGMHYIRKFPWKEDVDGVVRIIFHSH